MSGYWLLAGQAVSICSNQRLICSRGPVAGGLRPLSPTSKTGFAAAVDVYLPRGTSATLATRSVSCADFLAKMTRDGSWV